ncbi:MAG: ABC transporter ATP-binding protein [Actinomycetia bacterium]|nr:ABC transporter ATP-binding protein [Actinomycetes bacterium]
MMVLEVEDLAVYYGSVRGLSGVSLEVAKGEIVALLGANGAGKTTFINAVCGVVPVRSGKVQLDGKSIRGLPVHQRVRQGVVQVPEGRRIFGPLSVAENLRLAASSVPGAGRREQTAAVNGIVERFDILSRHLKKPAGMLSGGEQQVLAIVRALLLQPRLLLIDEPSLGLAPIMVSTVYGYIKEIAAAGTTILLVEQSVPMALSVAARGYVLQNGSLVLQGKADDLLADERLTAAYLGTAH